MVKIKKSKDKDIASDSGDDEEVNSQNSQKVR